MLTYTPCTSFLPSSLSFPHPLTDCPCICICIYVCLCICICICLYLHLLLILTFLLLLSHTLSLTAPPPLKSPEQLPVIHTLHFFILSDSYSTNSSYSACQCTRPCSCSYSMRYTMILDKYRVRSRDELNAV